MESVLHTAIEVDNERSFSNAGHLLMLSRCDSVHHLLRLGLLRPDDLVDRPITVSEQLTRNHLIRVEKDDGSGFIIKEPRNADELDASTMWMEATVSWLSANDPSFGRMKQWLPQYLHYHEPQKILTCELISSAEPLVSMLLSAPRLDPAVFREIGKAFGTLHGAVSIGSAHGQQHRLFSPLMPWVLTLGSNTHRYAPRTVAAAAVLREVMLNGSAVRALAQLREHWRSTQVIHGDAKTTNILVLEDSSIRIVDWEISNLGDGLWDVASIMHSLIVPNPRAHTDPLDVAMAKAAMLIEPVWEGYLEQGPSLPPGLDARGAAYRMAGARLIQTCLECGYYPGRLPGSMPLLLDMAFGLLNPPDTGL
jgi:Predicted aminoglycoside phosphotransferase